LRDGTQGERINFSAEDKCRIARQLDELGVDFIEGGWPARTRAIWILRKSAHTESGARSHRRFRRDPSQKYFLRG